MLIFSFNKLMKNQTSIIEFVHRICKSIFNNNKIPYCHILAWEVYEKIGKMYKWF